MNEILLIEDSEADATLLKKVLKEAKVTNPLHHLSNGAEAMTRLQETERKAAAKNGNGVPSILLLDLKLPAVSGFEILSFLRGRPPFAELLKIVVSDLEDLESIRKAYSLGAHSFLTKPVHRSDLKELIRVYPTPWVLE